MKRICINCCKKVSLWALAFLFFGVINKQAIAQTPDYFYLPGTAIGNVFPLASTTNKAQYLFYPTDFNLAVPAGNISRIYFRSSSNVASTTFTNFTVKMATTNLTQFASGPWFSPLTTVYQNTTTTFTTIVPSTWHSLDLQTPFFWDGVSNLIVEISQEGYTTGVTLLHGDVTNRRLYGTVAATTGSVQARLMHLGIDMGGVIGCTGAPSAGVATASSTSINCGDSISLYLNGADTGTDIVYQWQMLSGSNWVNFGTNDTIINSSALTVNTQFRCEVTCTTAAGGTSYSNVVSITVNPNTTFAISPANPVICQGDFVQLNVTTAGNNFEWEPPTGLDTIYGCTVTASPTLTHSYTITGVDSQGCIGSGTVIVTVVPLPTVVFSPENIDEICAADTIQLILKGGHTFNWTPAQSVTQLNDTTFNLYPATTTNYNIQVIGTNNCENDVSKTIKVNPLPTPVISREGRLLSAPTGYTAYMWYKDGLPIIPIAWQNLYNMKSPGMYFVEVTDSNGCVGVSNTIDATETNINEIFQNSVSIYPNPTTGIINIECNEAVAIKITSLDGRILKTASNTNTVDVSELSNGLYFITVKSIRGNGSFTQKITKSGN